MKLALVLSFALISALPAHADDEDIDVSAGAKLDAAKKRVQDIDATAKTAPPEQQAKLRENRDKEVAGIIEIANTRPQSPSVNLSGAKVLVDVNEPAKSLPFGNRAVELAPTSPEARVVRGSANFALGNYQASAEDARTALRFDPKNENARALLKFSESRLQDMASRVKVPQKPGFADPGAEGTLTATGTGSTAADAAPAPGIAKRDADTAQAVKAGELLQDAHAKLKLGDAAGATRLAHKATLLAPTHAGIRTEAAYIRLKAGDAPGALGDAELASGLGPKPPAEALLIEAAGAAEAGDFPRVLSAMERAAKLAPRYAPLRDLAQHASSDELLSALHQELAAHFGGSFETALSKFDAGRAAEAASTGPAAPPAARLARNVLSAAGIFLILGAAALWLKLRRMED